MKARLLIFITLALTLVACAKKDVLDNKVKNTKASNYVSRDGLPTRKATKPPVPVIVKAEDISRYGNPANYRINGKNYEVLRSAHGYKEKGLASWYGNKFDQRLTSSGEEYDVHSFTAAHKTLPLPTYVRVKNLENGKELTVKVNDRGPFHDGRIIDLSYAAAKSLGFLQTGTAKVEVEAIATSASVDHNYYLQVGAFSRETLAKKMQDAVAKFTKTPVNIDKYKDYFVVLVGPFNDKIKSDKLKKILSQNKIANSFSLMR